MVRCTVASLGKLNKIIVKGNLIWTFVFANSFLSPGNIAGYFDLEFSLFSKTFSNITTFAFEFCFSLAIYFEVVAENIGWSVSQLQSCAPPPKVVITTFTFQFFSCSLLCDP